MKTDKEIIEQAYSDEEFEGYPLYKKIFLLEGVFNFENQYGFHPDITSEQIGFLVDHTEKLFKKHESLV